MKTFISLFFIALVGVASGATTYVADSPQKIMEAPYPCAVELYLTKDFINSSEISEKIILFEMGTELTGVATAENFLAVYDSSSGDVTMYWHELETESNTNASSATYSLNDFYNPKTEEYYINLKLAGSWWPGFMPNNALITIFTWNSETEQFQGNISSPFDYPEDVVLDSIITEIDPQYIKEVRLNESGARILSTVPEPATATLNLLALAGLAARRRRK